MYQPRIDIATRQVVGAEALLRWRHPRYGVLAPEAFLPLADDTGLLVPIGAWVLREACAQARRWLDAGIKPLTVVVNITARQLRHGSLAEGVRAALEAALPGRSLPIRCPRPAAPDARAARGELRRRGRDGAPGGRRLRHRLASLPMRSTRASAVCIDRLVAGLPVDASGPVPAQAITLARGLNSTSPPKASRPMPATSWPRPAAACSGDLFARPPCRPRSSRCARGAPPSPVLGVTLPVVTSGRLPLRTRASVVGPERQVTECNCSMCARTGYLHLIVPKERFKLVSGAEALTTYQFNTGTARHLFCSVCGVKSLYVPRSHPDGYSVNARCLDEGTLEDMTVVRRTEELGRPTAHSGDSMNSRAD